MTNFLLPTFSAEPPDACQAAIGESHALGFAQHVRRNRFHGVLFQLKLHVIYFFELVEKPGIDGCHLGQLFDGVALAQSVTDIGKPFGMRRY